MISSVKIENFVIVETLEMDFQNGLITLTGETGAGKSVLVGAIDSVFGGNIKPGSLFNESASAILEITVSIDERNQELLKLLAANDIEVENNEIFFRKEINTNLQGRFFLNGRRISRQLVLEFRELLLDFHSQRDQQRLFDNSFQLDVIDAFAGLMKLRLQYAEFYSETMAKFIKLQELQEQEVRDQERIKLYEYQLHEINSRKPVVGEDDRIQSELELLLNSEEIISNSNLLEQQVYEDENSVYDRINYFLTKFSRFADTDERIKSAVEHLESSLLNLDDAVGEIKNLLNNISLDEARKEDLENRLNEINQLKQKYKFDIPGIISYAEKIEQEMKDYSSGKEKINSLKIELNNAEKDLRKRAAELSRKRKQAAVKLEKEIKTNIKALAITQADVKIMFNSLAGGTKFLNGLNATGEDEVDFLFTANAGIKVQPLKFAASGGELSRFLLVIKKILTDKLENKTIIFDEIDAGIGGKTANLLGEFIRDIGKYHQILCITHLAQIAVYGQQHFSIIKENTASKAKIIINQLEGFERKEEIARMLAGSDSELALKYAEEIMAQKENLQ